MTVTVFDMTYPCTKAVQDGDKVVLHLTDGSTVEYIGVDSWDVFVLEDGTWSLPDVTPEQQLRADVDFIAIMTGVML